MKYRHPLLLLLCVPMVSLLIVSCRDVTTEYIVPHPKHAEQSVNEAVTDILGGFARTQRDIEKAFSLDRSGEKGRLFLHIRGPLLNPELREVLHQEIGLVLEDAGYELVHFEEIEDAVKSQEFEGELFPEDWLAQRAARALNSFEGAGALDIHVTSITGIGTGELNFEGTYRERLELDVTTTAYSAGLGGEVFKDRGRLTTRSVIRQGERYYSEKMHGLEYMDRSIYLSLLGRVRALLPRLPERRG